MVQRYPVIVVGAGPAGATAARLLAEADIPVLLLERARLPRVKPCGGALTHRALPLLPEDAPSQLKSHPRQWSFRGRHGEPVTLTRATPYCHIVERSLFDAWLVDHASRRGALVHDGEAVTQVQVYDHHTVLTTTHDQYLADIVIAADGAHGIIGKAAGLPRATPGAAMEAEVAVDERLWDRYRERVEIHVGQYPWGYAWVIPRAGILNIGVGSFRPHSFPLKRRFFQFAEMLLGHQNVTPLAHPLPHRWRFEAPLRKRILFTGDAAGLMDAFSAEGIYPALKSGQMAAEAATNALTGREPLETYGTRIYQEFWPTLKSASKMALLFYPLAGFWSDIFGTNATLLSDYLDVAMGNRPYATLTRHAERQLLHHPSLLLRRPRA